MTPIPNNVERIAAELAQHRWIRADWECVCGAEEIGTGVEFREHVARSLTASGSLGEAVNILGAVRTYAKLLIHRRGRDAENGNALLAILDGGDSDAR